MKSPAPSHDSTGHDKESQASEDRDCAGPSEKSCGRLSKSSEYVTCVCTVSNHGHLLLTGGEKLEDVPTKVRNENDGTKKLPEDEEECDDENTKPAVAESEATREKVPEEGKKPGEAVRTEVAEPESEKDGRKEEEQEPISAHKK